MTQWLTSKDRKLTEGKPKIVSFCPPSKLWEQFRVVADKDEKKYTNVLVGYIRRYIQAKTS